MEEISAECHTAGIPARLHRKGRSKVARLHPEDWLYMRHPPLEGDFGYGFGGQIPGHAHVENQSVNSHLLGGEGSNPRDVLFDTEHGQHFDKYQIARFGVGEVEALEMPNPNTIKRSRDGKILKEADLWRFIVEHKPTPCMYPHCEIQAYKNGAKAAQKDVSNGMKTLIRRQFAKIADSHRIEMQNYLAQ